MRERTARYPKHTGFNWQDTQSFLHLNPNKREMQGSLMSATQLFFYCPDPPVPAFKESHLEMTRSQGTEVHDQFFGVRFLQPFSGYQNSPF